MLAPEQGEEVYQLNEGQVSAIEEAKAPYQRGEIFTGEETDKEMEEYLSDLVDSGEYQDNKEVIKDALKLHQNYREKVIADLRKEIDLGWDGPDSPMTMDEIFNS